MTQAPASSKATAFEPQRVPMLGGLLVMTANYVHLPSHLRQWAWRPALADLIFFPVMILWTYGAAFISYNAFEKHFLKFKRLFKSGAPALKNDLDEPLFSIITPTYNCKSKIKATLESVLSQDFKDFEHLVIDGNSRDGIQELLAQVEDPRVRSWSEPDTGIYDAMNKGVRLARGRYLIFLGAGDRLFPGALRQISRLLPQADTGVIYGNVLWGETVFDGPSSKYKICSRNICHQAVFYGRDVFKRVGHYDLKYPILADWAFNLKCFGERRLIIRHVPVTITDYEAGGISRIGDPVFETDKLSLIRRHLGMITCLRHKLNPWPGTFWTKTKQVSKRFIPPPILIALRKIKQSFPGC